MTPLYCVCILSAAALAAPPADLPAPEFVPNEIIVKFSEPAANALEQQRPSAAAAPAQFNWSKTLQTLAAEYKLTRIEPLCKNFRQDRHRMEKLRSKPKPLLNPKEKRLLRRLNRAPKGVPVPDLAGIYRMRLGLAPNQSLEQAVEAYQNDPDVEYAELNCTVSISAIPNDPLFPIQWPLQNTGQLYPASGRYNDPPGGVDKDIDAELAWDINTGSTEIVVAVLDTGVDYTHRDLAANMWTDANGLHGYDFLHDDNDPMDDHGHGTHCAGIIAAAGNNQLDITGVCWNARIMALKFLNSDGHGDAADAAEAVYFAVENGADILSNSWGTFPGYPKSLKQAFQYAYSQGVISVASAGNLPFELVQYPAFFDTVMSVAATDSNDKKAPFSTYGEYVDIAAPGVDVLSLRAKDTSAGTVYDDYTTILSGTSMSCPHVAGTFALMLSHYPDLDMLAAIDIIMDTTDHIDPEVCRSGRLNAYKALLAVAQFYAGRVRFNSDVYSCTDSIRIYVSDLNLKGQGTQEVTVDTTTGDLETIVLNEFVSAPGNFYAQIPTAAGEPNIQDGIMQLSNHDIITVTYLDENDGTGNSAVVTDTAYADCQPPVIYSVDIDAPGPEPSVTIETNEPTRVYVHLSLACGQPYVFERSSLPLNTIHTINLKGVAPNTDYYLVVQAFDIAANETIDDNHGLCYHFKTTGPGNIYVPAQYQTIQEAIFRAWDTSIIWLADGTYTGPGNTDIDFLARAVTLQSENGPQNCIIDCRASALDPHNAFYFHKGEDANSVVAGLTITGGYVLGYFHGGAITCLETSPLIRDCIITRCTAGYGGAISCVRSSPIISRCILTANTANTGGAVACDSNSPLIIDCLVTGNRAFRAGALSLVLGDPTIINSTICGNRAQYIGGVECLRTADKIIDTIIWNNTAPFVPQLRTIHDPCYSCIQDWTGTGRGNITDDPCFADPGYWDPNGTPEDANDDFWVQGDFHIVPGSPCIDAGDPNFDPDPNHTDIDNEPRLFAGRIDIGADEFVPVTKVPLKFTPRSFNPASKGRSIKAHIVLPEEFTVTDVDTNTPAVLTFLAVSVESEDVNAFVNDEGLAELEISFDHSIFCHAGSAQGIVTVTGLFTDGSYFRGTDTIKVVDNTLKHLAVLSQYWLQSACTNPDWCQGLDLDQDSTVNLTDFALFDTCCADITDE